MRLVRYFVVVAEQLHFGRAAAQLHIAQPSLSRQIQRLEEEVGARLFDRTPRGTRLTDAGAVFLPRAKALLRSVEQAAASARAAATPDRLAVGYTVSVIVTPAVRELRRLHPQAQVRAVHLDFDRARAALVEHRVDAVVTRLPLSTQGLRVTILYDEQRAVLLPRGHRLAGREFVTLADIADEPLPRMLDPDYNAFWRIDPRPDGRRAPDGPLIKAIEDKFELIADGQIVAIVPRGAHLARPDVVSVPLRGVDPVPVVLATRAGDNRRLLTAFRKCAEATLTGP
ncbi:MAG TPA: LysR substrate-binding domain-containing protein [Pseudonocardiaceae bacterium]|nr:LysR substrate-binding domain-containing protein [Pseudonocardiaceae bacterium]